MEKNVTIFFPTEKLLKEAQEEAIKQPYPQGTQFALDTNAIDTYVGGDGAGPCF